MKEQYIEAINQVMSRTEDIELLDFVYQVLSKSEEVAV